MNSAGRNIVIVAYYFPPLGLAGTHRPLAMANYLARAGHQVTVLTVKEIAHPVYDSSQLDLLDPRVKVVRAGSRDPARIAHCLPFVSRRFLRLSSVAGAAKAAFFPDSKVGFVRSAWRVLKRLLEKSDDPLLITTSPPVSSHLLGLSAKQELGCKWVADWRDIWESVPPEEGGELRQRSQTLIEQVLASADLLTATSPRTIEHWRTMQTDREYLFLPNGYDEVDFDSPRPPATATIGIYGTINHLVEIERLLEWIAHCRTKHPALTIRIVHTGLVRLTDFDHLLAKFDLTDCWRSDGYLPHYESVQRLRANAVNLISLTKKPDTSYAIPSKLFELLRAEPPLIAILPEDGATRHLLEEHCFQGVYLVDDQEQFVATASECLGSSALGSKSISRAGVEVFERTNQFSGFERRLCRL